MRRYHRSQKLRRETNRQNAAKVLRDKREAFRSPWWKKWPLEKLQG
jgi:hypothetical protein